jgi:hypothetical protein
MGTITLNLPVSATVITAGLHATNYTAIQNVINGGIDNNNISNTAGIVLSKLGASGASSGQEIRYNGTSSAYVPDGAYGTSLPGSPFDGQQAVLVDSTSAPTYQWRFRYNAGAAGSNKWEFIGGVPKWVAGDANAVANTKTNISTSYYYDSATMSFTVPRAGDWQIQAFSSLEPNGGAAGAWSIATFQGTTVVTAENSKTFDTTSLTSLSVFGIVSAAASTAVGVATLPVTAGTNKLRQCSLFVTPVRVA